MPRAAASKAEPVELECRPECPPAEAPVATDARRLAEDSLAGDECEGVAHIHGHLTLKDMVRGVNTTPRAVRFYEEQRLIRTAGRSPGGHRYFHPEELE